LSHAFARDHGKSRLVPGFPRQTPDEDPLRAAISLTNRMDEIELREQVGRVIGKDIARQAAQIIGLISLCLGRLYFVALVARARSANVEALSSAASARAIAPNAAAAQSMPATATPLHPKRPPAAEPKAAPAAPPRK
jgi:hypothetical protein